MLKWTAELTAEVRQRWLDNQSLGEIGRALHTSRNAIAGRLFRLRQRGEKLPHEAPIPTPFLKKPAPKRIRVRKPANDNSLEAVAKIPLNDLENLPLRSRPCSLLQLNDRRCHWPIGDPRDSDFCYCGGRVADGYRYCHAHCHMAFMPSRPMHQRFYIKHRK